MFKKMRANRKARKIAKARKELEAKRTAAHIELSNLYLRVERGEIEMDRHIKNQLWLLVDFVYPYNDEPEMQVHWNEECLKLPGWSEV